VPVPGDSNLLQNIDKMVAQCRDRSHSDRGLTDCCCCCGGGGGGGGGGVCRLLTR